MNLQSYMILAVCHFLASLLLKGRESPTHVPRAIDSNCFRFTQSLARVFRLPVPVPVIALAAPSSVGNIGQFRRDKRCEQFSHSRVI
jgi:hypothetical protein